MVAFTLPPTIVHIDPNEDRYCRIILQQIDRALEREPSREALLNLLQIAKPSLTDGDISNKSSRAKAMRSLDILIHPDKHSSGDVTAANKRFQDKQIFVDKCESLLMMNGPGGTIQSIQEKNVSKFPLQFHISDIWPFLSNMQAEPIVPTSETLDGITNETAMAFKCVNYRGTIAHGKMTELCYDLSAAKQSVKKSAAGVFFGLGGHITLNNSIEDIKEELMNRGPVLSVSFFLKKAFLDAGDHSHAFESSLVNHRHAVLIVGWKQTAFGEMWLIRSSKISRDIPVSMGQYSIEAEVLAPSNDFSDTPWQNEDKAFDVPDLPDNWYSLSKLNTPASSEELESLFRNLKCSWSKAVSSKMPFVIRQAEKKARSRYAHLTDIEWDESTRQWQLHSTFCDQQWTN